MARTNRPYKVVMPLNKRTSVFNLSNKIGMKYKLTDEVVITAILK